MLKLARDVANTPIQQLWQEDFHRHDLQFDDGTIIHTDNRKTLFSRYTWEIHRLYPETPLLPRHHIGKQRLSTNTHLELLTSIFDCRAAYAGQRRGPHIEKLCMDGYNITNMMFNDFTTKLEAWISSIAYRDFLEVMNHPTIKHAMDNVVPNNVVNGINVDDAANIIDQVLRNEDGLLSNNLVRAYRGGMVKRGQVIQCIGPRGYATDIDSNIFRDPILKGFAYGITDLRGSMQESRSASKSVYFQGDPMADSEYFNRQLQLLCEVIREVKMTDCGSKTYIPWTIQQGTLAWTTGIYRLDPETNQEVVITDKDKHLVGKTIKIRSVFGCKLKDRNAVCARCLGDIAYSIPAGTILGHTSATCTAAPASQAVLSVKHHDGSASVESIILNQIETNYIETGADPAFLLLKQHLRGNKITLIVNREDAPNLHDLDHVDDVRMLSPSRYFSLKYVRIVVEGKRGTHRDALRFFTSSRFGFFTNAVMEFIKKKGWTYDSQGNYIIDFTDWSFDSPIVEIPKRHYSATDHMTAIKSYIMGIRFQGERSIIDTDNPIMGLQGIQDLVFQRLTTHLSHLQVVVLATLAENPENNDYRLPLDRLNTRSVPYDQLLKMRSIGGVFAYQGQWDVIHNPTSYTVTDRTPHILDSLLRG